MLLMRHDGQIDADRHIHALNNELSRSRRRPAPYEAKEQWITSRHYKQKGGRLSAQAKSCTGLSLRPLAKFACLVLQSQELTVAGRPLDRKPRGQREDWGR